MAARPIAKGCLLLLVLVLLLLAIPAYHWLPWRSRVRITGVVVDAATSEPVAYARVVVELVGWRVFDEEHMGYGIVADDQGRFSLDVRSPRTYTWIYVEASAPNNNFGVIKVDGPDVIVHTAPIPPERRNEPWLEYQNFRGTAEFTYRYWKERFTFVGESW